MSQVTSAAVWAAVENDSSFIAEIPEGAPRAAWQEYLDQLLPQLASYVDQPLTVSSLFGAKIAYLKHAMESGFVAKLIGTYPEEMLPMSAEEVVEMATAAMQGMLPMVEEIAANVPAWLEEQGATEDDFMASAKVLGSDRKLLAAYRKGGLTLGDLLLQRPALLLKNT